MIQFLKNIFNDKKSTNNYLVVMDIGTEYLKSLLIEKKSIGGDIVEYIKIKQNLEDMHAGAITDIYSVTKKCMHIIQHFKHITKLNEFYAVFGIAGELVKGISNNVVYERENPDTQITVSEIKNIIHKLQWKSIQEIRNKILTETGFNELDIKLINSSIVDIRIDGYKVTNPIGFQGKSIRMTIYNAYAPLVHIGSFNTIANELQLNTLSIIAEPYAISRCLSIENNAELNAIFIDVGGGTTDIAVVRNGGVEGTKSFNIGGRIFTKRIMRDLQLSFVDAEKIKIAYCNKKLNTQDNIQIKKILSSDIDVWLAGIEIALSEFDHLEVLPTKIYMCGGGANMIDLRQALENRNWFSKLPFARKPVIENINPSDVKNIYDNKKLMNNIQDITPMAIANIGIELLDEKQETEKILEKINKIIKV